MARPRCTECSGSSRRSGSSRSRSAACHRLNTPLAAGVESLLDVEAGLIHRREAPAVQFGQAPGRFSLGRRHDGQVLPGSAAQRFSWRPNSVIPLAIRLPGRSHRPRLQTGYLRVEQVRGEQVLDPPPSGLYLHSRYARKQRQWRWRCVTGAADRRGRDRRLCPCQLRAGELCAVRGKAPVLICSGAASRQDCLMGVQLGFMGVQLAGKVIGAGLRAAAAVRGLVSSSGRLSLCFPDDEASCCGCRGPALRAARSRLTAFVVSAPMGTPAVKRAWRIHPVTLPAVAGLGGTVMWLFLVAAGLCRRAGPGSSWSARSAAPAGAGEDERA